MTDMKESTSYILVDAKVLIELCPKVIERINAVRKKKDDEYIDQLVEQMNNSWWRKFAGKPPVTREQVLAREKELDRYVHSIYAWGVLLIASKLLQAAMDADEKRREMNGIDGHVRVSVDDWWSLKRQ